MQTNQFIRQTSKRIFNSLCECLRNYNARLSINKLLQHNDHCTPHVQYADETVNYSGVHRLDSRQLDHVIKSETLSEIEPSGFIQ